MVYEIRSLRTEDIGCGMKQCRTGMVRDGEQPWLWGPHSHKQLINTELWRHKQGAGQNWFLG